MQARQVNIILSGEEVAALDKLRRGEPDMPSRTAYARRLLKMALEQRKRKGTGRADKN